MKYTPHEYQKRATQFVLNTPRCALWLDMGLGKTAITLTAINSLIKDRKIKRVLIVAPLRVVHSTWPNEIKKWDDFKNLNYAIISGKPETRKEQIQQHNDIQLINYELIHWLVDTAKQLKGWPWDMIILDESTQVKTARTRRVRALRKVVTHVDRIVELTGTPSPNGLLDLWSQIYLLDQGVRLGRTQTIFRNQWFHYDPLRYLLTPKEHAQKEIENKIKDITLSMQNEDYLKLPPFIKNTIFIKLDDKHLKAYKQLEREMFITLAETGTEVEVFNAAALTNKCLQFSNGAVYTDDKGGWEEIHRHKLFALENIIEEALGTPVLVCYQYKSDAIRILQHFKNAYAMHRKDLKIIDAWNRQEIPIMVVHPASAGYGLNIQDGGNIIVWFGVTWNLEHYLQANARLHRQGQTKPVFVHHLIAQGTLDEIVLSRLKGKRKVQDLLLEAMKANYEEIA